MKNRPLLPFLAIISAIFYCGCNCTTDADQPTPEKWKAEIRDTERAFMEMQHAKGSAEAFAHFADSNAAILRGKDSLIHGREGIRHYYDAPRSGTAKATWAPDFVDVSADGTLGYTYGKYKWEITDSAGAMQTFEGVFHTVWKRNAQGEWRYVWD